MRLLRTRFLCLALLGTLTACEGTEAASGPPAVTGDLVGGGDSNAVGDALEGSDSSGDLDADAQPSSDDEVSATDGEETDAASVVDSWSVEDAWPLDAEVEGDTFSPPSDVPPEDTDVAPIGPETASDGHDGFPVDVEDPDVFVAPDAEDAAPDVVDLETEEDVASEDVSSPDDAEPEDSTGAAETEDDVAEDVGAVEDATDDVTVADEVETVDDAGPEDVGPDEGDAEVEDVSEAADIGADDTGPADIGPADSGPVGPPECDPPLSLTAPAEIVLPYDLVTLTASGGTGSYRFELDGGASGGLVNPFTGAYLSGGTVGVVDVVKVSDLGCEGTASFSLSVVDAPQVHPSVVSVPPGTAVHFEVVGGAGTVSWSLVGTAPDSVVAQTGLYIAGTPSKHTVRATDTVLGLQTDAIVTVAEGAAIVSAPDRIAVAEGGTFKTALSGGSGVFDVEIVGNADLASGVIDGPEAGSATLIVGDRYANLSLAVPVDVVAPVAHTFPRSGDGSAHAVVVGPGDIDGDGSPDAIVGLREADVAALDGGAVYIYAGQPGGLDPSPVRVLAGPKRRDFLGQAVVAADFDGDDQVDLAVSGFQLDAGLTDNGAVRIYPGVPGAFFAEVPSTELSGPFASDEFGFAMDSGDINGDGWVDLAISARLGEDRKAVTQKASQGAVHVFLGRPTGFLPAADVIVYGSIPTIEGPAYEADLQLGNALTVGDFDGDGAADVAVGSVKWGAAAGRTNDGFIAIYRGILASGQLVGGIETGPVRALGGTDAVDKGTNLGRYLAAGDVDGDGADELIVSQYLRSITGKTQVGAVRIWKGAPLPEGTLANVEPAEGATWTLEGTVASDQTGWWVDVGDYDGTGPLDIVAGDLQLEVAGGIANVGTVRVFAGHSLAAPGPTASRLVAGKIGSDRFGQAAALIGDLDGDAISDLAVFAGLNDDFGPNVGRPYFVRGAPLVVEGVPQPDTVALQMPGDGAGSNYGRGAAIVPDLNGDGFEDLVVGAPNAELDVNTNAGLVYIYPGSAIGFSPTAIVLGGFYQHSGSDQFGWSVVPAGDFDDDGYQDLAILARAEDRIAKFDTDTNYVVDGTCKGATSNSGAVYVFRGASTGFPSKPSFVYFPPQDNVSPDSLAGRFDIDGDGFSDLVLGTVSWDTATKTNAGAALVVRGRTAAAVGKIRVICDASLLVEGLDASDALGRSVTGVADVNGDGCDEVAIGANAEDLGQTNQGTVRIIWGYGSAACGMTARQSVLAPGVANAQAGFSLDAGGDVDGDTMTDVAVGGFNLTVAGNAVGGAWILRGSYLAPLAATAVAIAPAPVTAPFALPGSAANVRVEGTSAGEQFGRSVAIVPGAFADGRAGLLVGGPLAAFSGALSSGGARLYRFTGSGIYPGDGLVARPAWGFGGETWRPEGRSGEWVFGGTLAGKPWVVVTGYEGQGAGLDQGSVYVAPVK